MDWLARAWESPARPIVLPAFVLSRRMVAAIGFLGVVLIGYPEGRPAVSGLEERAGQPAGAVGRRLVSADCARRLRLHPSVPADEQQNIAFFPAYPLLRALDGCVAGRCGRRAMDEPRGNEIEWHYRPAPARRLRRDSSCPSASFAWALVYLFRLAREMTDDDAAAGAVLMASAWPYAIFFNALYTEALFLLACVGGVLPPASSASSRPTAAWGLLAGLSRPNGFLLSVPLATARLQSPGVARTAGASEDSRAGATDMPLSRRSPRLRCPVVGMPSSARSSYRADRAPAGVDGGAPGLGPGRDRRQRAADRSHDVHQRSGPVHLLESASRSSC